MLRSIGDKIHLNYIGLTSLIKEQIYNSHISPTDISKGDRDKIIVITGGNRGIGFHAAKIFLEYGYCVVIGCRRPMEAIDKLTNFVSSYKAPGTFECHQLDLMDLTSIKAFAEKVLEKQKINVLINNAGIMFGPRNETADKFEFQFMTNYLSHFYLTSLLLPALKRGGQSNCKARIVNVTSVAHHLGTNINFEDLQSKKYYSPESAYGNSKMAQILFTKHLQSLINDSGDLLTVNCVHPGIILTDLYTHVLWVKMFKFFATTIMKSPEQGGDSIVFAALSTELEGKGGIYLENTKIAECNLFASSLTNQEELWKASLRLLNKTEF